MTTLRTIAARGWSMLVLRGTLAIVLGIVMLASPGAGLAFVVGVVAAYLIIDGIAAVAHGVAERRRGVPAGGWFLQGVVAIVAGVLALAWPGETALVLLYIVGFWAVIAGVGAIATSISIRRHGSRSWIWVLVFGAAAAVFGISLFVAPVAGLLTLLWLVGVWALVAGVMMLAAGFSLRRIARS